MLPWAVGGELAYEAALLTSELVANAVRHAHSEVDVRLSRTGSGVRIEVADHDPHPLAPRRPGPDDTDGRGLYLVGALARDWGVRLSPPGKTVWFELDLVDQQGKRNVVVDLRDMTERG
jgi:anti-sigma regulatory factor (Ser/Thr protein kinase)